MNKCSALSRIHKGKNKQNIAYSMVILVFVFVTTNKQRSKPYCLKKANKSFNLHRKAQNREKK